MVRNMLEYYPVTQNYFVEEYLMPQKNVQYVFLGEKWAIERHTLKNKNHTFIPFLK